MEKSEINAKENLSESLTKILSKDKKHNKEFNKTVDNFKTILGVTDTDLANYYCNQATSILYFKTRLALSRLNPSQTDAICRYSLSSHEQWILQNYITCARRAKLPVFSLLKFQDAPDTHKCRISFETISQTPSSDPEDKFPAFYHTFTDYSILISNEEQWKTAQQVSKEAIRFITELPIFKTTSRIMSNQLATIIKKEFVNYNPYKTESKESSCLFHFKQQVGQYIFFFKDKPFLIKNPVQFRDEVFHCLRTLQATMNITPKQFYILPSDQIEYKKKERSTILQDTLKSEIQKQLSVGTNKKK